MIAVIGDDIGGSLGSVAGIAHGGAQARNLQDFNIVHAVAHGDGFPDADAQMIAELLKADALVCALGNDLQHESAGIRQLQRMFFQDGAHLLPGSFIPEIQQQFFHLEGLGPEFFHQMHIPHAGFIKHRAEHTHAEGRAPGAVRTIEMRPVLMEELDHHILILHQIQYEQHFLCIQRRQMQNVFLMIIIDAAAVFAHQIANLRQDLQGFPKFRQAAAGGQGHMSARSAGAANRILIGAAHLHIAVQQGSIHIQSDEAVFCHC